MHYKSEQYFRGSQHIEIDLTLSQSGNLDGVYIIKNDSMGGFCGSVALALHDAAGNVLQVFETPSACIDGKPPGHEIRRSMPWHTKVAPDVLPKVTRMNARILENSRPGCLLRTDCLGSVVDVLKKAFTAMPKT